MRSSSGRSSSKSFWSVSSWKARLKRKYRKQSAISTDEDFHSARPSPALDLVRVSQVTLREQNDNQTQYSSSLYSKDDDPNPPVGPTGKPFFTEHPGVGYPFGHKSLDTFSHVRQPFFQESQAAAGTIKAPCPWDASAFAVGCHEGGLASTPNLPGCSAGEISAHSLPKLSRQFSFERLLWVFPRVYAMAKVVQAMCLSYGAELDETEFSLTFWIKRAEKEVRTGDLATLVENVNNLFYALYSRVTLELAGIELVTLYQAEHPPRSVPPAYSPLSTLPVADHIHRLLLACKETLDKTNVCGYVDQEVVSMWQEVLTQRLIVKGLYSPSYPDNVIGYRQFTYNVLSDHQSEYVTRWVSMVPFFYSIPPNILIAISEKWFTVADRTTMPDDIPASDLPFTDLRVANPVLWEKDLVLDYRLAALASLEGKSIGDVRRENPRSRLLNLAKCRKCICPSTCGCARGCTIEVEKPCICSERYVRLITSRLCKSPGRFQFSIRTTTAARACWQGLAMLRRDVSTETLMFEWSETFSVFELEVQKERWGRSL